MVFFVPLGFQKSRSRHLESFFESFLLEAYPRSLPISKVETCVTIDTVAKNSIPNVDRGPRSDSAFYFG